MSASVMLSGVTQRLDLWEWHLQSEVRYSGAHLVASSCDASSGTPSEDCRLRVAPPPSRAAILAATPPPPAAATRPLLCGAAALIPSGSGGVSLCGLRADCWDCGCGCVKLRAAAEAVGERSGDG